MRFLLALLSLGLMTVPVQAGENWPQFRGPKGDGQSDAHGLAVTWSENENIRWKTAIHDKGWSSPVIWGEQIWMTTARADGKEFFAVCVDRKSGRIIHDLKIFSEEKPAFCHAFNSYASPTPVVEEGKVYIHFGSHGTACLDSASGKVLWERRDLRCDHFRGPGSSPIVFDGLLILTFDGFDFQYVTALDKTTGATVWRKDRNIKYSTPDGDYKKAYATPTIIEVGSRPQLICPSAEATNAFDPATGEELWRVAHGGMNAATRPVYGHGLVFLTSGHSMNLVAVRPGPSEEVNGSRIAWKTNKGVPTRPSQILVGDLLFMVNDAGIATCLEAKTGKQLWQDRLGGKFTASPVCTDGIIYLPDEDGKTHVIEAKSTFKKLAANPLDAGCMASPAISGDEIFIRTKTHLYCIGKK